MCRPAHRPLKYTFHATVGPISGIAYVTSRSFHQGLASVGHGSCEAGGQGCSRAPVRRPPAAERPNTNEGSGHRPEAC